MPTTFFLLVANRLLVTLPWMAVLIFLPSCEQEPTDVRKLVPDQATWVTSFKPSEIFRELDLATSLTEGHQEITSLSCVPEVLFSPGALNSGCVFSEKWTFYQEKGSARVGALIPLNDKAKLNSFMAHTLNLSPEVNNGLGQATIESECGTISLHWNQEFLVLSSPPLSAKVITERTTSSQIPQWATSPQLYTLQGTATGSAFPGLEYLVNQEDTLHWAIDSKEGTLQFLLGQHKQIQPLKLSKSDHPFSLTTNFPMEELNDIAKQLDSSIQTQWDTIYNVSDGTLALYYLGKGMHTKEAVSFDYDDDFNQIEVRKKIETPYQKIHLQVGFKNDAALETTLSYLKSQGFLSNEKSGGYTSVGSPEPLFIDTKSNSITARSLYDTSSFELAKPQYMVELQASPQLLYSEIIAGFLTTKERNTLNPIVSQVDRIHMIMDLDGPLQINIEFTDKSTTGGKTTKKLAEQIIETLLPENKRPS